MWGRISPAVEIYFDAGVVRIMGSLDSIKEKTFELFSTGSFFIMMVKMKNPDLP